MSLVTTCPHCGTVFSMVLEQLEASEGHVRCGHCMEVFDAKSQLASPPEVPDVEDHVTPEEVEHSHLSFVQQAKKQAFWSKTSIRFGLLLACLLLLVSLAVQFVHSERERVVDWVPSLKPVAQQLCALWVCKDQARRQIDAWVIENSSFEKEPSTDNAIVFRLTVQLKNSSKDTLLLPHLELSLVDNSDSILARRVIDASADGLPAQSRAVPRNEERSLRFLIKPEANAGLIPSSITGYHLVLFYP